jgi:hypothetical protein
MAKNSEGSWDDQIPANRIGLNVLFLILRRLRVPFSQIDSDYSENSEADGEQPVAQKARKIWSRVTAIPRRSRTPHPNVPNEGLDCVEQALLSQFWSKLPRSSLYRELK